MTTRTGGGHGPARLALSKADAANALGVSVDFFEDHIMSWSGSCAAAAAA